MDTNSDGGLPYASLAAIAFATGAIMFGLLSRFDGTTATIVTGVGGLLFAAGILLFVLAILE